MSRQHQDLWRRLWWLTASLCTGAGGAAWNAAAVQLPYRMVFAVATKDSIILYDTQVQLFLCGPCSVIKAAAICAGGAAL